MSNHSSTSKTWFAGSSAAAVCVFGLVSAPAPAQAAPCSNWEFPHGYVLIGETTTGFSTRFDVQPVASTSVAGAPADGTNNKGVPQHGNANGAISGRHMDVTVNWDNGGTQRYVGDVTDDAHANGQTANGVAGQTGLPWATQGTAFTCADPAPAAKPDTPKPADQPADQPAVQPTATVLGKTDIYNAPNGKGTQFKDADGVPIFKPRGTVKLVAPELCDTTTNWCHVVAPEVPGGTGFIYIGDGLGTFP